jgi:ubiquinone/menaquinone biosynthesis C-methylase UbiE
MSNGVGLQIVTKSIKTILDIATGTGDLAICWHKRMPKKLLD